MPNSVSVVVPTYRGNATLPELVQRLISVLMERGQQFEILLIEDASPDMGATWRTVKELAQAYPQVKGFRLLKNRGQHNALLLGIRSAQFDTIVTIDDDLQNLPEDLHLLLNQMVKEDADVVYGVPREKQHGSLQNLGSYIVRHALAMVIGNEHAGYVTSFRAFKTNIRDTFVLYNSPQVSIDALLGWGATKYSKVLVEHQPRRQGQSGYNFSTLVGHALTMITHYSTIPLRISTVTGVILVLCGAGISIYVVIGRLFGFVTQPGFAFLVSLFSIIDGAQLLALGIIGEYLATIFLRSLGMTAYTVAEKTDHFAALHSNRL